MKYPVAIGNKYKALDKNIINALNSIYYVLYEINLEKNSYREFATVPGLSELLPNEGSAKELLQVIINKFCKPDYRLRLAAFLDIDTFAERLEKSNVLTYEYRAETVEWALISILPFDYDEEGKAKSVILAVRDISTIKEQTHQYQNLIQALATPYANLYTINMYNGSMQIHHIDSYIMDNYGETVISAGYEKALELYVANEVLPEDKKNFEPIRTVANCKKIFAKSKDYSFVYRVLRKGEIHYFICNIIKPSEERNEFALGFRNIDDKMAEQELQKLELQNKLDIIEEYRQALEEQMAVVSGLAKDYYSVMLVDYIEDTVMIREARDEDGKQIANFFSRYPTWSEGIKAYAATKVVESEKEEFYKALSLEAIRTGKGDYTSNYQKVTDNGIKHLQFKVAYVTSNEGRPLAVVGTRSIEKEFQTQIKLQETNDKLQRNFNIIGSVSTFFSVLYYVSLTDYSFLSVNTAEYESIVNICGTSVTAVEAFKRVKDEVINPKYAEEFDSFTDLSTLADRLADRKVLSMQFIGKDAGWFEGYFIAADRNENGRCTHVLWAVRTIQEQKEKDLQYQQALEAAKTEAENANMAKTSFLFSMSHDIRTPMNAIIGFTSLASTHINKIDLVKRYLQKIMVSSNHLLSLINDVLDMSRIESGTVTIKEVECSLPAIIHDLRSILQSDIKAKNFNFFIDTLDIEHEDIFCDKLKFNQVLLNLLGNAIKFTPAGGTIGIKIIEENSAPEGFADFKFIVTDTGIGINKNFLDHIFEPFVREENSTVSGIQGTGLGLAITKNIINMMGGTITVKSEKNKGSEFTIALRLRTSAKQKQVEIIKKLEGMRALVVDNSADTCVSVARMLKAIGMHSDWTTLGKEAVLRAKVAQEDGDNFKVYIIDWLLPDMNGIEVVRRIRQIIGNEIPIIIITAYDWSDIEEEAIDAGVTAFCPKPIFLSELYDILSALTSDRKDDQHALQQGQKKDTEYFEGKRVLLVEDVEVNREIAIAIMEDIGILVDAAENGQIGLEKLKKAAPGYYDIVCMDIMMPIMNGYTATKAIRELDDPNKANIPIIAMTANAFEEDKEKAKECGMDDFLTKPFQIEQLVDLMKKHLK